MQMVRQYHHRDDVKRMELLNFSHGAAKYINVFGKEAASSIGEIDGEKIDGSGLGVTDTVCRSRKLNKTKSVTEWIREGDAF